MTHGWVEPVWLHGQVIRLEPLQLTHAAGLRAAAELEFFRYFMSQQPSSLEPVAFSRYLQGKIEMPRTLPFAVVLLESESAIGTTSYMDIREEHRSLEIGMTWYGRIHQGTNVNPECKLLLLEHAFEVLGAVRVQLKTDGRNLQSQAAISKLGAKFEGRLRKHAIQPNGFVRDTMMYSITDDEWPNVKAGLLRRLAPKQA